MDYPCFIKRLPTDEEPAAYVMNAEEHAAQLAGWGVAEPAVPAVPEFDDAHVAEPAAPTKEDLQAECELRGIEYDKRWGIAKLQEALAAAE